MSQLPKFDNPEFKPELKENNDIRINAALVENISPQGQIEIRNQPDIDILKRTLTHAKNAGLCKPSENEKKDSHSTRVLIMPISSLPASGIIETLSGKRGGIFSDKVAFCWTLRGTDLTPSHQDGFISGVMIMSAKSVNLLLTELKTNPEKLLNIISVQNGNKPIHRYDGTPADLTRGTDITFLPNKSLGGSLASPIRSKPFIQNTNS